MVSVEEIWRGLRPGEETVARRLFKGLRLAPLGVTEGMRAGGWRRAFAKRESRCRHITILKEQIDDFL